MELNVGDFIRIKKSSNPGIIVRKYNGDLVVSITEFEGDYIIVNENKGEYANINPEEKLSILSKFSEFFYEHHKELYQNIIIENIIYHSELTT